MRVIVSGGRAGAQRAAREGHVAIIVDALRASATTASLLQFGVQEIIVVEGLEQAFAERERQPGAWLAGERGGLKVKGFNLGNSPLTAPLPGLTPTVVFSSSNMSRCCVGAATAPATFLGSTVTCQACATLAWQTARELGCDLQLVPAGSVLDELKLVLEDYVACGALIEALRELGGEELIVAEDATRMAADCHAAAQQRGLTETFLTDDNGVSLRGLGFEADVVFASQMNRLTTVPRVSRVYELPDGTPAAVLTKG